jgi:hypothetical protein
MSRFSTKEQRNLIMKHTLLAVSLTILLTACGGGDEPPTVPPPPIVCAVPSLTPISAIVYQGVAFSALIPIKDAIGFAIGGHPTWQIWGMTQDQKYISVSGTPQEVGNQILRITLNPLCGNPVTVDAGNIETKVRP